MLIAVFSDIHANRQAFEACLAQARSRGAERIVLLGDYVGYGADPDWTVTTVMQLVEAGAVALRGNHDDALACPIRHLNGEAQSVIDWTRTQLSLGQQHFLAGLALTAREEDRLYVHSDASAPPKWHYVTSADDAVRSLKATDAAITLCGHVHRPAVYSLSATWKVTAFRPVTGVPVPLLPGRRWLLVLGSVGQPRDGDPAASFAMLDTATREITYCRAAYDVEAAAAAIRAQCLPERQAERLFAGK